MLFNNETNKLKRRTKKKLTKTKLNKLFLKMNRKQNKEKKTIYKSL